MSSSQDQESMENSDKGISKESTEEARNSEDIPGASKSIDISTEKALETSNNDIVKTHDSGADDDVLIAVKPLSNIGDNSDFELKWEDDEIEEDDIEDDLITLIPPQTRNDGKSSGDTGDVKEKSVDMQETIELIDVNDTDEEIDCTHKNMDLKPSSPEKPMESQETDEDNISHEVLDDDLDDIYLCEENYPEIGNEPDKIKDLSGLDSEIVDLDKEMSVIEPEEVIGHAENEVNASATSSPKESLMDNTTVKANAEHGLNKQELNVEIPTQDEIECVDVFDSSHNKLDESITMESYIADTEKKSRVDEINIDSAEDVSLAMNISTKASDDAKTVESQSRTEDTTKQHEDVEVVESVDKELKVIEDVHSQSEMQVDLKDKQAPDHDFVLTEMEISKEVEKSHKCMDESILSISQEGTISEIENEVSFSLGTMENPQSSISTDTLIPCNMDKLDSTIELTETSDSQLDESFCVLVEDEEMEVQVLGEYESVILTTEMQSETLKQGEKEESAGEKVVELESPQEEKDLTQSDIGMPNVAAEIADKDGNEPDKDGNMEVDTVVLEDEVEPLSELIADAPAGPDDLVTAPDAAVVMESDDKTKLTVSSVSVEIETVKLSDTSDCEMMEGEQEKVASAKESQDGAGDEVKTEDSTTTSSIKNQVVSQGKAVFNIVELEESSSEDDVQEVVKGEPNSDTTKSGNMKINVPMDVDVAPLGKETAKESVNAPRLNVDEITIKPVTGTETTLVIPEVKPAEEKPKPKFSLEIFSLDSDEEDQTPAKEPLPSPPPPVDPVAMETEKNKEAKRCINLACDSDGKGTFYPADTTTVAYFDASRRSKALVCEACALVVAKRTQGLVAGIREMRPLLELGMDRASSELVEISDSDEEDDLEPAAEAQPVGSDVAEYLEKELAKQINEVWSKYKLDSRLNEAQDALCDEIARLKDESKELDSLMLECQQTTDKLRTELYATFPQERRELSPWVIYDTPVIKYNCLASKVDQNCDMLNDTETSTSFNDENSRSDDDKDISVMKVSVESAPQDLPPPGELTHPPLRPGMMVYAIRSIFGSWMRCRLLECHENTTLTVTNLAFTMCRVKFEAKMKNSTKILPARSLAYIEPSDVRLTIGTRVIALFKDASQEKKESFFSGIVAEVPNPVNSYRYLVFFDDGYAQYVRHRDTRLVCECSPLVWEEVHPFSREFVREYLMAYPERPMVRLHAGQSLKTEWNGKWWASRVLKVDASLVNVHFEEDNRTEWIYRGSTRLAPLYMELQAAERHRGRPMPRTKVQPKSNMPYVEYTRSDEQSKETQPSAVVQTNEQRENRQRAVAKKSTTQVAQPQTSPVNDSTASRVVYYTPKNVVKPYKMTPHQCGPRCRRSDVLALRDLRTYNPLAKPLLSGWERQFIRYRGQKLVMYRAPCGRRLRNMREVHRYLRLTHSDMAVDLFDFTPSTHCLAEFVMNTFVVGKKDLSHGKENVPVPCVNFYDESLPEFCSYNTDRTPTAGVPLNLDPEFLCGCDCTDDCENKSQCACWKLTLEGARTIGLDSNNVGYDYKRLPEPLPSGIYECNSRCKCKHTCLNRVAQQPLQLKLQVFKTKDRGWGIRALNDVPKGAFLCVYAGNLLTDATANMDGLNEGDEYLAELDYIEVVEQMKEGYEEDIPEADKQLDKKNIAKPAAEESRAEASSSEEEDTPDKDDEMDDDFKPGYIGVDVAEFSKRLRQREKKPKGDKKEVEKDKDKAKETEMETETENVIEKEREREKKKEVESEKQKEKEKESIKIKEAVREKDSEEKEEGKKSEEEKEKEVEIKSEDDCITISDDEEVREPSRFMAQAGMMGSNEFKPKYKSVRSYFGVDEACYIMDAKVQGNIGRYLNHSCSPNVFVQNVFVDTHDPRFPWVAFFALSHIRSGTELTWNYNYDVGSVPGKVLYCHCGANNCRGRLL